jgi:subtilisin family serine protease
MITKRYFGKQVNEIEIYLENTLFRKTLFFTGECAFKKAWLEKFDKNKKVKKVIITDSNGKISKEFENNPSVLPLNQIYNEQSLRSLKLNDETETVKVAILDSGFDYNHPGLAYMIPRSKDNAINGRDFYENDNLPYEEITPKKIEKNSINHGTHVAGIATKGIKDVVIIPIVFNSKFYYESIQFAYDQGARIINMSFGSESAEDYRAIEKAMNDFPDMLFIAGAGNDKTNIDSEGKNFFPAEFKADNLITVAAVNKDNNLARFSNYGMESVDVAAQGVFIKSFFTGGDTGYASGTSMATPQVTNLAIRIKQVNPDLSPVEIKEIIMKTVIKTDELELRVKSGGFIDFENAINYASKI